MKKNIILVLLFFCYYQLFANYTGNITIYQNNLKYSKIDIYDLISITGYEYITTQGAPKLPAKYLQFIIPNDKRVAQIIINRYY